MSEFDDEWLSENPMDSPIGGTSTNIDEDGLRLATNSPLYTGPASLQASNRSEKDPYTIAVEGYDDEDPENPKEQSPDKNKSPAAKDEVSSEQSKQQRRRNIIVGSVCILLVIICIIVGVVVSKNNKKGDVVVDPNATTTNSTNSTSPPSNNQSNIVVDTEDEFILPYQGGDSDGVVLYTTNVGPFEVEIPTLASNYSGSVYEDESELRDGLSRSALFLMNNVAGRLLGYPGFSNAGFGSGGFALGAGDDCGAPSTCAPGNDVEFEEEITSDAPDRNSDENNVDSFKTNNQETSVDEADVAKSDGTFIYAAYGSNLLVFSAHSDEILLKLQMPPAQCLNLTEDFDLGGGGGGPNNDTEAPINNNNSSEVEFEPLAEDILFPNPGPEYSCPEVNIEAILLDTNHSTLALIVSGYGNELREQASTETPVFMDFLSTQIRLYSTKPLINNAGISLLGVQNVNGYYRQGYVMESTTPGIAHVVTESTINTQDWLVTPVEALKTQKAVRNVTDENDAFQKSLRNSRAEIVGSFVNQTILELSATTGDLPRIAPLRLPIVNSSGIDGFENVLLGSGYGTGSVHIASFDMRGDAVLKENSTEGVIPLSETVQFVESSWGEVCAADTMLIKTGVAYSFNGEVQEDMTVLYAYSLDNMTSTPFAAGAVPGLLLNRYALDYHDGLFRAATTTRTWAADDFFPADTVSEEVGIRSLQENVTGRFVFLATCPSAETIPEDDCLPADLLNQCANMTSRGCTSIFYHDKPCPDQMHCLDDLQGSQCPLPSADEDNVCLNGENLAECLVLEQEGCENIAVAESCPLQFSCAEEIVEDEPDEIPISFSSTKNRIFVLERPSEEMPEIRIVGNTTMGKPDEVFTAVRFFDSIAYAVTFLQTDPFYVISFEEPRAPVVLGELEISGFSSYMHSIDANNTKILTVGTETTPEGMEIGVKLSLFDATNQTNPTEVAKLVFSENSWSDASWDFRSFRYVPLSEGEASIIIPVFSFDPESDESFDGFVVFSLSGDVISESFRISHKPSDNIFQEDIGSGEPSCNQCAYLAPRSFVVQGNITTLKSQSAQSYNLETGDLQWSRDFIGEEYCCS